MKSHLSQETLAHVSQWHRRVQVKAVSKHVIGKIPPSGKAWGGWVVLLFTQ